MTRRFYLDVVLNVTRDEDVRLVQSNLMHILHGFNRSMDTPGVGVSFPRWHAHVDVTRSTVGTTFRFVGDRMTLNLFSANAALGDMADHEVIDIHAVQEVPEDVDEVRFVRDRLMERFRKEKEDQSIEAFADYITSRSLTCQQHGGSVMMSNAWPPAVALKSRENRKVYPIRVRMESSPTRTDGTFSSYGLSHDGTTVPFF